jgi:peptidoglycan/LPS O-acetylase OafA/YrhL
VIRIVYADGQMVALFFIISGFVPSIKPLRLGRHGRWTEFSHSLVSSVFQGGLRLYLPCIPSTLVVMLAAQLRLFPDEVTMVPTIHDSLWAQCVDWMSFFFQYMMNIWSFEAQNPDSHYGPHLWTIPFEFRDIS